MGDISTDQVKPCWFIDLDWCQQANRSFSALAQGCLCSKCRERLKGEILSHLLKNEKYYGIRQVPG